MEEVTREIVILALILSNREEMVMDLKAEGNFGGSECEMIDFKILRTESSENSKRRTMGLKKSRL